MSDVDPPPPSGLTPRKRLPIEEPLNIGMRFGPVLLYGSLALALAIVAAYGALVGHYPLMSGYVIAPAIGALWFGLRLFMTLNTRK